MEFLFSLYRVQLFDSAFEFAFTSLLARLLTNVISSLSLFLRFGLWGQSANTITKRIMAIMTFQLVNNREKRCACVNALCVCVSVAMSLSLSQAQPPATSTPSLLSSPSPSSECFACFWAANIWPYLKYAAKSLGQAKAQGNSDNNKLLQILYFFFCELHTSLGLHTHTQRESEVNWMLTCKQRNEQRVREREYISYISTQRPQLRV